MSTIMQAKDFNFSLKELQNAAAFIYKYLSPTPQISWPLVNSRCGCEVWVKHENHLPTGAFKVRGGIWYLNNLCQDNPDVKGIITATRGNHGQSVAFAARMNDVKALVVVPHGNNPEKNRAMQAYGAELIEYGRDFDESLEHARELAVERNLHMFPSIHPYLVQGVSTCSIELLQNTPALDTVYVPIGLGSGICGMIAARNALNCSTQIVGVVAENAPTYALSFAEKSPISTGSADTLADGLAVRIPNEQALNFIVKNVERIVTVSEEKLLKAIYCYFHDTHNIAEGAGASGLAAVLKEKEDLQDKKIGVILSGGNIDRDLLLRALNHSD